MHGCVHVRNARMHVGHCALVRYACVCVCARTHACIDACTYVHNVSGCTLA